MCHILLVLVVNLPYFFLPAIWRDGYILWINVKRTNSKFLLSYFIVKMFIFSLSNPFQRAFCAIWTQCQPYSPYNFRINWKRKRKTQFTPYYPSTPPFIYQFAHTALIDHEMLFFDSPQSARLSGQAREAIVPGKAMTAILLPI